MQELENELNRLRADADRLVRAKDEEIVDIRRKLMAEIESLTARLQESESRLRNEVEKMKKKMSVTITELEMSLDAANKNNAVLQNTTKVQQVKIQELTQIYEETRSKLQSTVAEYQSNVQRVQVLEQEINVLKQNLSAASGDRRAMETKIQDLTTNITNITNINNQLSVVKEKMEVDLKTVNQDYQDIARELKLADDRANKAGHDAQHFECLLREENAKLQRADQARKALETEVSL